MPSNDVASRTFNWRVELPMLCGSMVTLREPIAADTAAIAGLLSLPDATAFDVTGGAGGAGATGLIERAVRDRRTGAAFTYAVALTATSEVVGLIQVRQLDPFFEGAIWECTMAPRVRGIGVFVDAARLVASFAFASAGVRRLEARLDVNNGRAMAALRKLGGVQEGILRRAIRRGNDYLDQALWAVLKETFASPARAASAVVH